MAPSPDGRLTMPANLVDAARDEGRSSWLVTVPRAVTRLAARWSLTVGEPFQPGGRTAWVAPARDPVELRVLKIAWPHPEAEHEADGLRAWAGRGAVELYASDNAGDARALLLEHCSPGTPLSSLPEPDQDVVLAGLLPRLWAAPVPGPEIPALQGMCDLWADGFDAAVLSRPALDRGLVREGISLFRSLPASADRQVLLATDLHAGNVLAARREPWLMIDPKPYVGDPTYDPLQHMLNCTERLEADPRGLAGRMADLLGLDADRLRLWLFARCVQESLDSPHLADVARRLG